MEQKYTDSEYLFKCFLCSKLDLKASYLDIPDNNCFSLCINEVIKNLGQNMEKPINDYSNALIKNFYNYLINDNILKNEFPALYGSLLSKFKEYLAGGKLSKKELYGYLLDVRKRNYSSYFKALFKEIERLIKIVEISDVKYSIKIYNIFLNELLAKGIDIRFLYFSLSELDTNNVFDNFQNYLKYIANIKPFDNDVLDILVPIKVGKEQETFLEICDKRNQKYEIIDNVVYCKIYDCYSNDFFTLIEEQLIRISSIFDLMKLYTYYTPAFNNELDIKIKSKKLAKDFTIPFHYINQFTGNKPYTKHIYNTINSLDASKETDVVFYHKILNTLSYAEKDLNYKNSSAFVDTWIALETLCSISEVKNGYEAVQHYVPKLITTTIIRQNINNYLIKSYKNYFKDIKLEEYLSQITLEDCNEFLEKIPNRFNRFELTTWAEILKEPKSLMQFIQKLQDQLYIDILRIYMLRNEYVHSCNLNAFQTLEFYKLKSIFNIVIDEFFRCLTNRKDKDESRLGIGFDIFNQFNYKWDIMIKSLELMYKEDTHTYKSDTQAIIPDKISLKIELNKELTYSQYLLNLLKNNNEILKKYIPRKDYETKSDYGQDSNMVDYFNIIEE